MKEGELTTQVMKDMDKYFSERGIPFFYHKIADMPKSFIPLKCPNCKTKVDNKFRFTPQKFVDVTGSINGRALAIEFKLHRSPGSFPIASIRENQRNDLVKLERSRGLAYYFIGQIYSWYDTSKKTLEGDMVTPDDINRGIVTRLYCVPAYEMERAIDRETKKSIKLINVFGEYKINRQKGTDNKTTWQINKINI